MIDTILESIDMMHYIKGDLRRHIQKDINSKDIKSYYLFLINRNGDVINDINDATDYYWDYATVSIKKSSVIDVHELYYKVCSINGKPMSIDINELKIKSEAEKRLNFSFETDPTNWIVELIRHTSKNIDKLDVNHCYYLPVLNISSINNTNADNVVELYVNDTKYAINIPNEDEFIPVNGLFNIYNGIGQCSAHVGLFACESKEQAMFISKYYAYELFVAMYGNSPFVKSYKLIKRKNFGK